MKKLYLIVGSLVPLFASAQDTSKVIYGDTRYMEPTFKTKNNFQVHDIKKCDGCLPNGMFAMHADTAMKKRLYVGEIVGGKREGVWSYFDHEGNTVCEEEYAAGKLIRYTIFKEGTEVYERVFKDPTP